MNLKPASVQTNPIQLIADLDALVSEKVGFKFNNKIYVLNPVTAEQLMLMELARIKLVHMLNARAEGVAMSEEDVYLRYFEFIHPIVPEITYPEIRSMSVVVLNSLLNLVFRQLSGDPTLYQQNAQKKNPLNPVTGL